MKVTRTTIRRIKVNPKLTYEIMDTGMLKASHLIDDLLKKDYITKKRYNVINRLSNLLVDGHSIKSASYDTKMHEVVLVLEPYEVEINDDELFN